MPMKLPPKEKAGKDYSVVTTTIRLRFDRVTTALRPFDDIYYKVIKRCCREFSREPTADASRCVNITSRR